MLLFLLEIAIWSKCVNSCFPGANSWELVKVLCVQAAINSQARCHKECTILDLISTPYGTGFRVYCLSWILWTGHRRLEVTSEIQLYGIPDVDWLLHIVRNLLNYVMWTILMISLVVGVFCCSNPKWYPLSPVVVYSWRITGCATGLSKEVTLMGQAGIERGMVDSGSKTEREVMMVMAVSGTLLMLLWSRNNTELMLRVICTN